jgi:hypothetical protein
VGDGVGSGTAAAGARDEALGRGEPVGVEGTVGPLDADTAALATAQVTRPQMAACARGCATGDLCMMTNALEPPMTISPAAAHGAMCRAYHGGLECRRRCSDSVARGGSPAPLGDHPADIWPLPLDRLMLSRLARPSGHNGCRTTGPSVSWCLRHSGLAPFEPESQPLIVQLRRAASRNGGTGITAEPQSRSRGEAPIRRCATAWAAGRPAPRYRERTLGCGAAQLGWAPAAS